MSNVIYKKIKEICLFGDKEGIVQKDINDKGLFPVINSSRNILGYVDRSNNPGDTVVLTSHGAYAGFSHYMSVPFFAGALSYPMRSINDSISNKYLYYILKNNEQYIRDNFVNKSGVPYINAKKFLEYEIPIIPIEEQNKIVDILDKFTKLEAELEAELEARKKQYEFWRAKMLDGEKNSFVKLSDVAFYSKDRIIYSELNENNYVGVDNLLQNKLGKTISNHVPNNGNSTKFIEEDILIGNIRPYLKKIWFSDCIGGTNGDVLDIRVKDKNKLNPRYLFYVLSSDAFFEYDNAMAKGAKMPRGDKTSVMNYEFYLPDIETQKSVVKVLDNFESLTNSMISGLPAEIELRRKQYKYYRNKLLSFEDVNNETVA